MRRIVTAATLIMVASACSVIQSEGAAPQVQGRPSDTERNANPIEELVMALGLQIFLLR